MSLIGRVRSAANNAYRFFYGSTDVNKESNSTFTKHTDKTGKKKVGEFSKGGNYYKDSDGFYYHANNGQIGAKVIFKGKEKFDSDKPTGKKDKDGKEIGAFTYSSDGKYAKNNNTGKIYVVNKNGAIGHEVKSSGRLKKAEDALKNSTSEYTRTYGNYRAIKDTKNDGLNSAGFIFQKKNANGGWDPCSQAEFERATNTFIDRTGRLRKYNAANKALSWVAGGVDTLLDWVTEKEYVMGPDGKTPLIGPDGQPVTRRKLSAKQIAKTAAMAVVITAVTATIIAVTACSAGTATALVGAAFALMGGLQMLENGIKLHNNKDNEEMSNSERNDLQKSMGEGLLNTVLGFFMGYKGFKSAKVSPEAMKLEALKAAFERKTGEKPGKKDLRALRKKVRQSKGSIGKRLHDTGASMLKGVKDTATGLLKTTKDIITFKHVRNRVNRWKNHKSEYDMARNSEGFQQHLDSVTDRNELRQAWEIGKNRKERVAVREQRRKLRREERHLRKAEAKFNKFKNQIKKADTEAKLDEINADIADNRRLNKDEQTKQMLDSLQKAIDVKKKVLKAENTEAVKGAIENADATALDAANSAIVDNAAFKNSPEAKIDAYKIIDTKMKETAPDAHTALKAAECTLKADDVANELKSADTKAEFDEIAAKNKDLFDEANYGDDYTTYNNFCKTFRSEGNKFGIDGARQYGGYSGKVGKAFRKDNLVDLFKSDKKKAAELKAKKDKLINNEDQLEPKDRLNKLRELRRDHKDELSKEDYADINKEIKKLNENKFDAEDISFTLDDILSAKDLKSLEKFGNGDNIPAETKTALFNKRAKFLEAELKKADGNKLVKIKTDEYPELFTDEFAQSKAGKSLQRAYENRMNKFKKQLNGKYAEKNSGEIRAEKKAAELQRKAEELIDDPYATELEINKLLEKNGNKLKSETAKQLKAKLKAAQALKNPETAPKKFDELLADDNMPATTKELLEKAKDKSQNRNVNREERTDNSEEARTEEVAEDNNVDNKSNTGSEKKVSTKTNPEWVDELPDIPEFSGKKRIKRNYNEERNYVRDYYEDGTEVDRHFNIDKKLTELFVRKRSTFNKSPEFTRYDIYTGESIGYVYRGARKKINVDTANNVDRPKWVDEIPQLPEAKGNKTKVRYYNAKQNEIIDIYDNGLEVSRYFDESKNLKYLFIRKKGITDNDPIWTQYDITTGKVKGTRHGDAPKKISSVHPKWAKGLNDHPGFDPKKRTDRDYSKLSDGSGSAITDTYKDGTQVDRYFDNSNNLTNIFIRKKGHFGKYSKWTQYDIHTGEHMGTHHDGTPKKIKIDAKESAPEKADPNVEEPTPENKDLNVEKPAPETETQGENFDRSETDYSDSDAFLPAEENTGVLGFFKKTGKAVKETTQNIFGSKKLKPELKQRVDKIVNGSDGSMAAGIEANLNEVRAIKNSKKFKNYDKATQKYIDDVIKDLEKQLELQKANEAYHEALSKYNKASEGDPNYADIEAALDTKYKEYRKLDGEYTYNNANGLARTYISQETPTEVANKRQYIETLKKFLDENEGKILEPLKKELNDQIFRLENEIRLIEDFYRPNQGTAQICVEIDRGGNVIEYRYYGKEESLQCTRILDTKTGKYTYYDRGGEYNVYGTETKLKGKGNKIDDTSYRELDLEKLPANAKVYRQEYTYKRSKFDIGDNGPEGYYFACENGSEVHIKLDSDKNVTGVEIKVGNNTYNADANDFSGAFKTEKFDPEKVDPAELYTKTREFLLKQEKNSSTQQKANDTTVKKPEADKGEPTADETGNQTKAEEKVETQETPETPANDVVVKEQPAASKTPDEMAQELIDKDDVTADKLEDFMQKDEFLKLSKDIQDKFVDKYKQLKDTQDNANTDNVVVEKQSKQPVVEETATPKSPEEMAKELIENDDVTTDQLEDFMQKDEFLDLSKDMQDKIVNKYKQLKDTQDNANTDNVVVEKQSEQPVVEETATPKSPDEMAQELIDRTDATLEEFENFTQDHYIDLSEGVQNQFTAKFKELQTAQTKAKVTEDAQALIDKEATLDELKDFMDSDKYNALENDASAQIAAKFMEKSEALKAEINKADTIDALEELRTARQKEFEVSEINEAYNQKRAELEAAEQAQAQTAKDAQELIENNDTTIEQLKKFKEDHYNDLNEEMQQKFDSKYKGLEEAQAQAQAQVQVKAQAAEQAQAQTAKDAQELIENNDTTIEQLKKFKDDHYNDLNEEMQQKFDTKYKELEEAQAKAQAKAKAEESAQKLINNENATLYELDAFRQSKEYNALDLDTSAKINNKFSEKLNDLQAKIGETESIEALNTLKDTKSKEFEYPEIKKAYDEKMAELEAAEKVKAEVTEEPAATDAIPDEVFKYDNDPYTTDGITTFIFKSNDGSRIEFNVSEDKFDGIWIFDNDGNRCMYDFSGKGGESPFPDSINFRKLFDPSKKFDPTTIDSKALYSAVKGEMPLPDEAYVFERIIPRSISKDYVFKYDADGSEVTFVTKDGKIDYFKIDNGKNNRLYHPDGRGFEVEGDSPLPDTMDITKLCDVEHFDPRQIDPELLYKAAKGDMPLTEKAYTYDYKPSVMTDETNYSFKANDGSEVVLTVDNKTGKLKDIMLFDENSTIYHRDINVSDFFDTEKPFDPEKPFNPKDINPEKLYEAVHRDDPAADFESLSSIKETYDTKKSEYEALKEEYEAARKAYEEAKGKYNSTSKLRIIERNNLETSMKKAESTYNAAKSKYEQAEQEFADICQKYDKFVNKYTNKYAENSNLQAVKDANNALTQADAGKVDTDRQTLDKAVDEFLKIEGKEQAKIQAAKDAQKLLENNDANIYELNELMHRDEFNTLEQGISDNIKAKYNQRSNELKTQIDKTKTIDELDKLKETNSKEFEVSEIENAYNAQHEKIEAAEKAKAKAAEAAQKILDKNDATSDELNEFMKSEDYKYLSDKTKSDINAKRDQLQAKQSEEAAQKLLDNNDATVDDVNTFMDKHYEKLNESTQQKVLDKYNELQKAQAKAQAKTKAEETAQNLINNENATFDELDAFRKSEDFKALESETSAKIEAKYNQRLNDLQAKIGETESIEALKALKEAHSKEFEVSQIEEAYKAQLEKLEAAKKAKAQSEISDEELYVYDYNPSNISDVKQYFFRTKKSNRSCVRFEVNNETGTLKSIAIFLENSEAHYNAKGELLLEVGSEGGFPKKINIGELFDPEHPFSPGEPFNPEAIEPAKLYDAIHKPTEPVAEPLKAKADNVVVEQPVEQPANTQPKADEVVVDPAANNGTTGEQPAVKPEPVEPTQPKADAGNGAGEQPAAQPEPVEPTQPKADAANEPNPNEIIRSEGEPVDYSQKTWDDLREVNRDNLPANEQPKYDKRLKELIDKDIENINSADGCREVSEKYGDKLTETQKKIIEQREKIEKASKLEELDQIAQEGTEKANTDRFEQKCDEFAKKEINEITTLDELETFRTKNEEILNSSCSKETRDLLDEKKAQLESANPLNTDNADPLNTDNVKPVTPKKKNIFGIKDFVPFAGAINSALGLNTPPLSEDDSAVTDPNAAVTEEDEVVTEEDEVEEEITEEETGFDSTVTDGSDNTAVTGGEDNTAVVPPVIVDTEAQQANEKADALISNTDATAEDIQNFLDKNGNKISEEKKQQLEKLLSEKQDETAKQAETEANELISNTDATAEDIQNFLDENGDKISAEKKEQLETKLEAKKAAAAAAQQAETEADALFNDKTVTPDQIQAFLKENGDKISADKKQQLEAKLQAETDALALLEDETATEDAIREFLVKNKAMLCTKTEDALWDKLDEFADEEDPDKAADITVQCQAVNTRDKALELIETLRQKGHFRGKALLIRMLRNKIKEYDARSTAAAKYSEITEIDNMSESVNMNLFSDLEIKVDRNKVNNDKKVKRYQDKVEKQEQKIEKDKRRINNSFNLFGN